MAKVKTNLGFTLIEAAVAIGVVAILAGMMLPLGVKILDQHREEATRKALQTAFEAMFGSKERRVANMRADLGFGRESSFPFLSTPAIDNDGTAIRIVNLEDLIRKPPEHMESGIHVTFPHGAVLQAGQPPQNFAWGWNGPYWHGPAGPRPTATDHIRPLDAWGNPIRLILYPGYLFQFRSGGRGGNILGGTHINYPVIPAHLASFNSVVIVRIIKRDPNMILTGQYFVRFAGLDVNGNPNRTTPIDLTDGPLYQNLIGLPPGPKDLCVVPRPSTGPSFEPMAIPFDVLPGETREVSVTLP